MTTASVPPTPARPLPAAPLTVSGQAPRVAVVCTVGMVARRFLYPQAKAAQQAGYDVTMVCTDGPYVEGLRADGMTVETIPILRRISPWLDALALRRLTKLFRRKAIDIVHTHTPKGGLLGQLAAKRAGTPVRINTVHGLYYAGMSRDPSRWLFRRLELHSCRLADHVFSQSAEDVDTLLRDGQLPPERVEWLGNGIDLRVFRRDTFAADEGRRVRDEVGIPAGAFVVGVVARMVREKGFVELFDAFARLREGGGDAYLLHIGEVDRSRGDEITPHLASGRGIEPYCRFMDERDDVPRLLTAMDVFCLASYREGYPRSVMEASAMGIPAVVTDIRGSREVVSDDVNGLVVPVRDSGALAAAMKRLHDDVDLRGRLAAGARRRAEELFDEDNVFRRVLACYERLLRRAGRVGD